jgi:hypothetical protein
MTRQVPYKLDQGTVFFLFPCSWIPIISGVQKNQKND